MYYFFCLTATLAFISKIVSSPVFPTPKFHSAIRFLIRKQEGAREQICQTKKKYYTIEYTPEIVEANSQKEAIAIAKQRIQDREVGVDEENTSQVEDEDLLKEIEEDERKADEEEARATAKPKK